jgi:catalase
VGPALAAQTLAQRFVHEAWRHGKPIAVAPDAEALLAAAGVPVAGDGVTVAEASTLAARLIADLGQHRFPRRVSVLRPS